MILIQAGSFWMGCGDADNNCNSDEYPYHQVGLSAYYMDRTEVTMNEYNKCVDAGVCTHHMDDETCRATAGGPSELLPSQFRGDSQPMVCVTWSQAGQYCEWAGKRLPTEAEWEKAARGTDGRKYPWGNEIATCDYAVMLDNRGDGCGTEATWPVCSKSPAGDSPYGLCDMSGNVSEWVADWYSEDYYSNSPLTDPTGPSTVPYEIYYRAFRGGSFNNSDGKEYYGGSANLRTSDRYSYSSRYMLDNPANSDLGFRCATDEP